MTLYQASTPEDYRDDHEHTSASSVPSTATSTPERKDRARTLVQALYEAQKEGLAPNLRRQWRFVGIEDGEWVEIQTLAHPMPDEDRGRTLRDLHRMTKGQKGEDRPANRAARANGIDAAISLFEFAEGNYQTMGLFVIPSLLKQAVKSKNKSNAWFTVGNGAGSKDDAFSARRVLMHDFDTRRAEGVKDISATEPELRRSLALAVKFHLDCDEILGSGRSLGLGHSGNGGHVYLKLDPKEFSETDEIKNVIRRHLLVIDALYTTADVAFDTAVHDAKRLYPAAGTLKRKGFDDREDGRIHRRTAIVCDDEPCGLSRRDFDKLAAAFDEKLTNEKRAAIEAAMKTGARAVGPTTLMTPAPTIGAATTDDTLRRCKAIDIREVARALGIDDQSPACPACGNQGGTSVAFLDTKGKNILKCLHATCGERSFGPVDLVAKAAFGVDELRGTKGVVTKILTWFEDHFGIARVKTKNPKIATTTATGSTAASSGNAPPPTTGDPEDQRTVIQTGADLHRVVNETCAVLSKDSGIYERERRLVRVLPPPAPNSAPEIDELPAATLTENLTALARFTKFDRRAKDWIDVIPSEDIVKATIARKHWPGVRPLVAITEMPVLRPDGTVLDEPGYDAATRLIYQPTIEFERVPDNPTKADGEAAIGRLLDLVRDVPFVSDADRAGWTCYTLTAPSRSVFEGPTPMYVSDGNRPSTGKTMILQAGSIIGTGRHLPTFTWTSDAAEMDKRITGELMKGSRIVLVDDVKGELGGNPWDAMLTATIYGGRILGTNTNPKVPNLTVWCASGNNIVVKGDTVRRVVHFRLESPDEAPQDRTSFAHGPLLPYVEKNRASLLRDALIAVRAFLIAKPKPIGLVMGSFEGWAGLVAECVAWYGVGDATATRLRLRQEDRSDDVRLARLLREWGEHYGDRPLRIEDVLAEVRREDLRVETTRRLAVKEGDLDADPHHRFADLRAAIVAFVGGRDEGLPKAASFGARIRGFAGRVAGGRKLASEYDTHVKVNFWKVVGPGVAKHDALVGTRTTAALQPEPTEPSPDDVCITEDV